MVIDLNEIEETVEEIDDVIEDVVDAAEDLGLISESEADTILDKVKLYKKYILLSIPVAIAVVVLIQSL